MTRRSQATVGASSEEAAPNSEASAKAAETVLAAIGMGEGGRPHPRAQDICHLARGWESKVNALRDLSQVLRTVVENAFPDLDTTPDERDVGALLFCVYQMQDRVDAFHDDYYAAVNLK